jgi:hypothetical protein
MRQTVDLKPPSRLRRAWLAAPLVAFALVSLTVGLVAHQTVPPTIYSSRPFFHLFFSDALHMKVWLSTAALLLGFFQLLTAARIYELLHFPPKGRFYNIVHRWSGRTAIVLTLPVAYHCIFLLGFAPNPNDTRVVVHSLLGSSFYGVFIGKVLIVRSSGFPGWALPIAGGILFSVLLGLWLTAGLWFFTTHGVGF